MFVFEVMLHFSKVCIFTMVIASWMCVVACGSVCKLNLGSDGIAWVAHVRVEVDMVGKGARVNAPAIFGRVDISGDAETMSAPIVRSSRNCS